MRFTQDFQRLDAERQQAVEDGRMTEDEYKKWRKNKLLYGMHWQRLIDRDTKELLKYNQTALKYINGEVPQIFASGYNDVAEQIPDSPVGGYDFELVNADTVNNLVHEEGIILPRKVLDPEKDVAWNGKLINAQLLQGILQGESIPEMAKRMQTVANSDLAGATRTARTMHTAAQNYGRQTGYNKAAKQGIVFEKTWLAANNERTRLSHAMMSGQTVAYDAKFVSPVTGVKLSFPGDWSAEGSNVGSEIYNCRCTMITKFKGFMSLKDAEKVGDGVKVKGWMPEDYTWKGQKSVAEKVVEKAKEIFHEYGHEEPKQLTFAERINSFREQYQNALHPENGLPDRALIDTIINNAGHEVVERVRHYPDDLQRIEEEYHEKNREIQEQIKTLETEVRGIQYLANLFSGNKDKIGEVKSKISELQRQQYNNNKELRAALDRKTNELIKEMKDAIAEVRSVGTSRDIKDYIVQENKGHKTKEKTEIVQKALQDYPTEWLDRMHEYRENNGMGPIKVKYDSERGIYMHSVSWLLVSNRGGDGTLTAYHELAHAMENHIPDIVDAEKAFYERRTAGEEAKWLGKGYSKDEKTKKDDFLDPYMGKDYGGHNYELCSMGFEKYFVEPLELFQDEDYFNFISGVLMLC